MVDGRCRTLVGSDSPVKVNRELVNAGQVGHLHRATTCFTLCKMQREQREQKDENTEQAVTNNVRTSSRHSPFRRAQVLPDVAGAYVDTVDSIINCT